MSGPAFVPVTRKLPLAAATPNETALSQVTKERFTGSTATILTLRNHAIAGLELVFKNGTLLDPAASTPDYFLLQNQLTLAAALVSSDVVQIHYPFTTSIV